LDGHAGLLSLLLFLVAVVVFVPLARGIGVSSVLGYLIAGVVLGPSGLGLAESSGVLRLLGEIGILFLLFAIGLELSIARLVEMRRDVLGLGTAQVVVTGALLAALVTSAGAAAGLLAVVVGLALALSSTAVVLQLLRERRELSHRHGRLSLAVLMLQDLAVIPLLVSIVVLAESQGEGLGLVLALAAGKALLAVAGILLVGRFLLRPVYRLVAMTRSPEALLALTLLLALGTGAATEAAGLSMSLGAFLAGLLVGETEYQHQVESDIEPFRALLLGLFFANVGLSIDLAWVLEHLFPLTWIMGALLGCKAVVIAVLARGFGHPWRRALRVGLLLAQVGELGLVALDLARTERLLDPVLANGLLTLAALTMFVSPGLAALGRRLDDALAAREPPGSSDLIASEIADLEGHVIVAGCGRVGHTVSHVLAEEGLEAVGLDLDPSCVARLRRDGFDAFVADAMRAGVLKAAGIERARALVVTVDDPRAAERICATAYREKPGIQVLARARHHGHGRQLMAAGASVVVAETLEGSLELAGRTLAALEVPVEEVERLLGTLRAEDYAKLDAWNLTESAPEPRGGSGILS
jgi:CPA2 family monovalent cation:H+ antiporter-2